MKYSFSPSAVQELQSSVEYYDECKFGLGLEFTQEINNTIERIIQYPESWPILSKNTRRCLVKRFPFGIIYSIEKDEILIIAVMHLKRKPGYWKERDRVGGE